MKYAKLAAERGRIWVKQMEPDTDTSSESSFDTKQGGDTRAAEAKKLMDEYKKMLEVGTLPMNRTGENSNPLKRSFFFC